MRKKSAAFRMCPTMTLTKLATFFAQNIRSQDVQCANASLLATQDGLGGDEWDKPVRIFPPRDREEDIVRAFKEARTCFRAKAFTAAAIMCRKTLEGICSAHGVKSSGTLAAQLKKLKDNEVIENRLFEWAEELRTMGNEAAHGVEVVIRRRVHPKVGYCSWQQPCCQ
jgi:hypothetical protein